MGYLTSSCSQGDICRLLSGCCTPRRLRALYHRRVEEQALKWWHMRWGLAGRIISRLAAVTGKIIGLVGLIAVVGFGVLYLLQPWWSSQRLGKFDPQLSIIPVGLSSEIEAPLSNSSIEQFGFEFRLPNKGIARKLDQTVLVEFPSGMLEFPHSLSEKDAVIFGSVYSDNDARKLLGPELLQSKYKLIQEAMSATPDQVKWWRFRSSQNERAALFLLVKFVALTESDPMHVFAVRPRPIYTIGSSDLRGFEFGNPDSPPYDTHVDLFDDATRHLAFDISGVEGHGQVLTQKEINAMVASIRLTSDH